MAKTKDLNSAMQKLKKNYKKVLKEAVEHATEQARKDVTNKAFDCLKEYYANYDPNSYDRTYSLGNAFLPYSYIEENDKYIDSVVGIEYDYSRLDGAYYSGSEKYGAKKDEYGRIIEYGSPQSSWIMDNYLEGVHPTTNGYPHAKGVDHMEYIAIRDPKSPTQKMNEYFDKYGREFLINIDSYLVKYMLKQL
jgi:hypothetical protein